MALLSSTSLTPLAFSENPKPFSFSSNKFSPITFFPHSHLKFPSFRFKSSASGGTPGPVSGETSAGGDSDKSSNYSAKATDEWGEEYEPEPEASVTKLPDSDPPTYEDEWEEGEYIDKGNASPATTIKGESLGVSGETSGGGDADKSSNYWVKATDEWGEEYEPEPEASITKLPDSDPPKYEDEWEEGEYIDKGNGSPATTIKGESPGVDDRLEGLKRALVDTVYGTDFGFRASAEVRAEVSELVTQLEAANPTLAPVEEPGLLNGNWVLLYTASSELLLLLAAGTTPLLKVDKISQTIDTNSCTIVNSTTLSNPFSYFSFSASATFEVRSPTRIQVVFKEGTLQPPEVKSKIDLPEDVDIFGQKLSLSPVQQSLSPLQDVVANISRTISGQPPLKVPIPGERTGSWLITTYLDADLRISRGDGGLFILAKEGSPLLDQ